MKGNLAFWALKGTIILLVSCGMRARETETGPEYRTLAGGENPYAMVEAIPVPAGYHRMPQPKRSFGDWLRHLALKKDREVRLYDGRLKRNQDAQFAVLDISVGNKDLQQCADAVMRLRAEYFFAQQDYGHMEFKASDGTAFRYLEWAAGKRYRLKGPQLAAYSVSGQDPGQRACFDAWLELVFSYCGTLSLERQLSPAGGLAQMQPGDVLIHGGSPGHAMIVLDMAEDAAGHRVYMLAQSYMPAQDIHIVRDPVDEGLSPWYRIDPGQSPVPTPEWEFGQGQLRTWQK